MTANCPTCNKEHNAENINKELGIITCTNCQTVFSAPYFFDPANPSKPENKSISIPFGYTCYKSIHKLQISLQESIQPLLGFLIMLIHTPIMCAFMIFVPEGSELAEALGLWIAYPALALFIGYMLIKGKKSILIKNNSLIFFYKPIPIQFRRISVNTIKQVYVKEVKKKNKKPSYTVHILQNTGNEKKLIANLKLRSEALYIEQEIESYLGLRDQAVDGEFR